jgi:SAM-dependent MidA family methyltransferase
MPAWGSMLRTERACHADDEREGALSAALRQRIADEGPISFHDFMEAALYHPEHGYYSNLRGFGPDGDFITSPELHPVFGALLGRLTLDLWEGLGLPRPFRVLELGGGSGALARELLDWARAEAPVLADCLQYWLGERSPLLRATQQQTLRDRGARWGRPADTPHFILANELLDALPVYRVVVRDAELHELRVGLAEGGFRWVEADSAPPDVRAYFSALGTLPPEGGVAEVNPGLATWAREIAGCLQRGLVLVLDYGYTAEDLYARPQGTLLTYYRHTVGSDPLVRVGRQDISTHVDFNTLATAAHRAGLAVLGLTTQHALLRNLGFHQFFARLPDPANRRALSQLVDPEGVGRVKALFLGKGLGRYAPAGLTGKRDWPEPTFVPSLPPEPAPDDFLDQWREAFGGTE